MGKRLTLFVMLFIFVTQLVGCSTSQKLMQKSVRNNVQLGDENVGGLKEPEIAARIAGYAQKIDTPPRDARLNENSWEIAEDEQIGKKLNIKKTTENLLNSAEGQRVELEIEEIRPGVTGEMIKGNIMEIGEFTTPLIDRQENRVNNIELAAEKINYKKLAPGEEFSFNGILGRRTESKGYEEAPIIIKTEDGYEKGSGVGGGICQLSTTIYNAVEKAGLEVTERHAHTKNVGYVPKGKDATVSYGAVDFKFRNNRAHPVMIRVYLARNSLTVRLFENKN